MIDKGEKQERQMKPPSARKVGIFGAGQLAQMLAKAALQLDLEPVILAQHSSQPAMTVSNIQSEIGSYADTAVLKRFIKQVQFIAWEQELPDTRPFERTLKQLALDPTVALPVVFPSLASLEICFDKLKQKGKLASEGIPTVEWKAWEPDQTSLFSWLEMVRSQFQDGIVLKWSKGGYDGLGNFFVPKDDQHFTAKLAEIEVFCKSAVSKGARIFAERTIQFDAEVAVISTRKQNGGSIQYPVVKTVQRNGVCSEVYGPATKFGVAESLANAAQSIAKRIGRKFDIVGTYAVEFFCAPNGDLWVNEIAPRVHNSGHFSLDASVTSQFENHWRALLDQDLGATDSAKIFGMINILGQKTCELPQNLRFEWDTNKVFTHWYHKLQSRPGRKLGHINMVADSVSELELMMDSVTKQLGQWHENSDFVSK